MASTINRAGITLTNDTGTPAVPVGDGTLLSAADRVAVLDAIDALFTTNLTVGGIFTAEGFGSHTFSTGGTGTNSINVRNTTAGTSNQAAVQIGNDTSASALTIQALSSTFTSNNNVCQVVASIAGGLRLTCSHASGEMAFFTNSTRRMTISASTGAIGIGTTPTTALVHLGGSFTGIGFSNQAVLSAAAPNDSIYGMLNNPTLVEQSSGTHPLLVGAYFGVAAVTGGAASVTTAASVYIAGAPSASGAANFALYVAAGQISVPDGSAASPTIVGQAGISSGIYWTSTGTRVNVSTQGVQCAEFSGSSVAQKSMTMPDAANGTGVGGQFIKLGRNSSGAGCAASLVMVMLGGGQRSLWVDNTGDLQIHTASPTEGSGDTAGTVVGDQTSTRATKRLIRRFTDARGALSLIKATPLYRFQYREGSDRETQHVGIMAEESPAFVRRGGKSFDPINAFGYSAAAIQALLARVEALEAQS